MCPWPKSRTDVKLAAVEHFDVLVIGGGQAGLAAGYYLSRRAVRCLIVDDGARVGDSWRRRWDSLRLFTPARIDGLPGFPFPSPPSATVTKDQVADYMESYARRFWLPVRLGVRVGLLTQDGDSFLTDVGIAADQVVIATGSYLTPRLPAFVSDLDRGITQLHSTQYRNPSQLRGDVLVVGAGNSGAEIAVEAARAGHRTWLSGRPTGHVPYPMLFWRPFWWLFTRPQFRRFGVRSLDRGQPLVRIKPRDLQAAGIARVPRVAGASEGKPQLEDGRLLAVGTVLWCTGFEHSYPWIKLPITDPDGHVIHRHGVVSSQPGLYFVGLPFQTRISSSLIDGVDGDAKYVVERIAARRSRA
ncbi:MAG TPA: NAD(P)-binding domain-containing protein [Candidatus Dormibacteraeota bacterium]|nr:NAD(P)-binding domain-containing protein [Candidatus Dormibacteraeota bacterium]